MNHRILFSVMMALLPFAGFAQVDDMYFIPRKEEPKKAEPVAARDVLRASAVADTGVPAEEPVYATGEIRDVDEYNRRGYEAWADSMSEDSVEEASEESGEDYACSKRILRFCTPTIGVAVSSPLYWDLCYGPNAIYWDVYDDGVYAYAFPSSWSTFYWGPYFSWSWGWGWPYYHWGWGGPWYAGWYDPWYWRPHGHYPPHWGHPGPVRPGRPVARPSLTHRQPSSLARGSARRNGTAYRATRSGGTSYRRGNAGTSSFRPNRSTSTTTRQPSRSTRSTYTPSRSSQSFNRGSSFTPSSRSSSFRPSVSSPSRGGGGFSPSRGGGGARGGRR